VQAEQEELVEAQAPLPRDAVVDAELPREAPETELVREMAEEGRRAEPAAAWEDEPPGGRSL
jgi:hypothetical protein